MKKILSLLLMFLLVFSLAGCKENAQNDADTTANVDKKVEEQVKKAAKDSDAKAEKIIAEEGQKFETENGSIRVLGVEKADPSVVDEENAYVVKFEVTNKADEPREGYEVFYWDIYQNNVEVTEINSHTNTGSDHAVLLGNRHKGIMNGGTLIVGEPVVLQDTSALTIFVRDGLDLESKTSLTINVE